MSESFVEEPDPSSPAMTVSYSEFVRDLCKPGEALLAEMTPSKLHLWHMSSAMGGEVAELSEVYRGSEVEREYLPLSAARREGFVEEFGDLGFYCEGVTQTLELAEAAADPQFGTTVTEEAFRLTTTGNPPQDDPLDELVVAYGNHFDAVKQWVIYNKPLNAVSIMATLLVVVRIIDNLIAECDISPAEIELHNRKKLAKRYNKLKYSDADAAARADKA
jgi:hypothetical protein